MIGKQVAGTIMLTKKDGQKSFLVNQENGSFHFVKTATDQNQTNMAAILKMLKQLTAIDLNTLDLVEQVSVKLSGDRTPLFVFEMIESPYSIVELTEESSLTWESSATLSSMLKAIELSSTPVFEADDE